MYNETNTDAYIIRQKLKLIKKIDLLEYNEKCEIYNIIKKDTDKISENNNGVFINLKYLKDDTIKKIYDFVDYCNKNKETMKNDETKKIEKINNVFDKNNFDNISKKYNLYSLNNKNENKETFLFKTYINKISVSSNSYFENKNPLNPTIKNNIIKFEGVKKRLYNKCKVINKDISMDNKIEKMLNDTYNDYESDDLDNYDLDNIENIKLSTLNDELREDLNYL